MPILTYTTSQGPQGGLLNSRVLIGRRIRFGIALADSSVSRLHAWIDPVADERGGWVITDAGSKIGTFVNDERIGRHHLQDGDVIRVGNVTLSYREEQTLPAGTKCVELIAPPPVVWGDGILFECGCGAPLWAGNELAGKRGICRHCRQPVTVPSATPAEVADDLIKPPMVSAGAVSTAPIVAEVASPASENSAAAPLGSVLAPQAGPPEETQIAAPGEKTVAVPSTATPAAEPLSSVLARETRSAEKAQTVAGSTPSSKKPAPSKRQSKCAVCHSAMMPGEETTSCPDCAMTYHAECWQENFGCSSYGCPKVNCLQGETSPGPALEAASTVTAPDEKPAETPWELILLAASVVGSLLGALLFGGLAAVVAVLSLVVLMKKRAARWGLLFAAIVICVLGIAGGLAFSDLWYFDARHLPPLLARHIHF